MPAFEHASAPLAVHPTKTKYRDEQPNNEAPIMPRNILKDPRVAKGSTYSNRTRAKMEAQKILSSSLNNPLPDTIERKKRASKKRNTPFDTRPTPNMVQPDLDLTTHLVEQIAPITVDNISTQTADFKPRPESPPFVPAKTGIDVETQLDNECFDFDKMVDPMLFVIVGKTMEQALLEVEEEEEMASLEANFQKLSNEKKMEEDLIKQREVDTIKHHQVKVEKLLQERAFASEQDDVRVKVAAVRYCKEFLPNILERIYSERVNAGEWVIPVTKAVVGEFLPWLYTSVENKLQQDEMAKRVVDDVLSVCFAKGIEAMAAKAKEEETKKEHELQRLRDLKGAEVGKVKINITKEALGGLSEDKVVGPLDISGMDTVGDLEAKIVAWLQAEEVSFVVPENGFLHLGVMGEDGEVKGLEADMRVLDIHGALAVLKPEPEVEKEGGEEAAEDRLSS